MDNDKAKAETYHVPVMPGECLEGLDIKPDGIYADMTFGGGGHSSLIVSRLSERGHLYGFDRDADSEANAIDDARFTFVRSDFRYLANFMRYYGVDSLDGVLADLGVSSHHLDDEGRGFSFRYEADLDMRMNTRGGMTAADVLNTYDEERLAAVLRNYGEVKSAGRIARAVAQARAHRRLSGVADFLEVLRPIVPPFAEHKELPKIFQALRIEVNDELGSLRDMLAAAIRLLKPGGRLVVMTYHSLEDRIVKNFIKAGNADGKVEKDFYGRIRTTLRPVNTRVVVPSDEEVERNPRSRSAKLRVAEKL